MNTAVLDTNILVSALLRASGIEALLIQTVQVGPVQPITSSEVLDEYRTTLVRPKFQFLPRAINGLPATIQECGRPVRPGQYDARSPDLRDTMIIWCALAADADLIVIGNIRHFPLGHDARTLVVRASEALDPLTRPA